jgi:hypothetical protein
MALNSGDRLTMMVVQGGFAGAVVNGMINSITKTAVIILLQVNFKSKNS